MIKLLPRFVALLALATTLSGCVAVTLGAVVVTASAVHDRRSVESVVDDRLLNVDIRKAIYGSGAFGNDSRIKISVYNGWVLLAGEVGSQARVDHATELVTSVKGLKKLFNELAPMDPVGLTASSRDRLLSIQAKAAIADIKDLPSFDASRVKVTSARGNVYLQGLLSVEQVIVLFETLED